MAVVALGVCLGFLPFNFHPARIFMGDAGALFLGLLMACATCSSAAAPTSQGFTGRRTSSSPPLLIPLVILGVPILDPVFAVVRRLHRVSWAVADRNHLHHRLMRLGHGQRRAVLILWAWTALLSGLVLYPTYTGEGDALVPVGVAALRRSSVHGSPPRGGAPAGDAGVVRRRAGGSTPTTGRHRDRRPSPRGPRAAWLGRARPSGRGGFDSFATVRRVSRLLSYSQARREPGEGSPGVRRAREQT